MAIPGSYFPGGMAGEPTPPPSGAPRATGGKVQPITGTKQIKAKAGKAHTRTVVAKPPKPKAPALDATTKSLINAAVRLKFGGAEQGVQNQLQDNTRFAAGVPGWYKQALGQIQQVQTQNLSSYAPTLQGVQSYASPSTGTPEGDQAAASRNALNASYANKLGDQSVANKEFFDRLQGALAVQQGNTLVGAQRDRQGLLGQQTALKGQEGDFKATTIANQQSAQAKADQTARTENAKIQASLAIASGKMDLAKQILQNVTEPNTQSNITTRARNVKLKAQSQKETKNQHAVSNALAVNKQAEKAYLDAHPELKSKGGRTAAGKPAFTHPQTVSSGQHFRKALHLLDPAVIKNDPERAKRALMAPKNKDNPAGGQDPLMAEAVVQTIAGGGVSRKLATQFYRAYGIHLHINDMGEKAVGGILKAVGVK